MKIKFVDSALVLRSVFCAALLSAVFLFSHSLIAATSKSDIPSGVSPSDWQGIRAAHEIWKLEVRKVKGGWEAHNLAQQWTTKFDGQGFTAKPANADWTWGLELRAYGAGDIECTSRVVPDVKTKGQRLSYHWDDTVQEWFVNDGHGLEHGFSVQRRPPGPAEAPLSLILATRGPLVAEVSADARAVVYRTVEGVTAVNYSGLRVWDADGRALRAWFEKFEDGVILHVDAVGARYPLTVDPVAQQAALKASQLDTAGYFGHAVAISGDTVAVGSPYAGGGGSVYIFVRSGDSWVQQACLTSPHVTEADVANSAQPLDDARDIFGEGAEPDPNGDRFGWSVAISGDTLAIGARNELYGEVNIPPPPSELPTYFSARSGAVYIFVRSGIVWNQQAYLKASNAEGNVQDVWGRYLQHGDDFFGCSVAISGELLVVGASGEGSSATGVNGNGADNGARNSGAAYVFGRSGTAWSQQAYLKASNSGADDLFGCSVAISGELLVVGAPGTSCACSSKTGGAFLFARNPFTSSWSQQLYVEASSSQPRDLFGCSVAVSGDDFVVGAMKEDSGASNSGAAYLFRRLDPTGDPVSIDVVAVCDSGNAADDNYFGRVNYGYFLGRCEVTIGQYTSFLNTVARRSTNPYISSLWQPAMAADTNSAGIIRTGRGVTADLYSYLASGSSNRPITYLSWFDAARFVNWLHNGATEGSDTETGAYTLNGATNGPPPAKNANAKWWIPTENEWYKAAYYKGGGTNAGYWLYPTQSDLAPGNNIAIGANQANYYAAGNFAVTQASSLSPSQNYLTDAGAFSGTLGPYGTYDQGGNVWEWNDLPVGAGNVPGQAGLRGGAWDDMSGGLKTDVFYDAPTREENRIGFRVAGALNTDADLSELHLFPVGSPAVLPAYDEATATYTAVFPFSATGLVLKPVAAHVGASVEARVSAGVFSVLDPAVGFEQSFLSPGLNAIEVRVISPSRLIAKTYRVLVSRGSSDSNLAAMTLSAGTLSPAFQSATTIYSANVANETASLTVTPTAAHSGATLQLRLNNGAYATVSNGSPSNALSLNVGMNDVQLKVTSEDGSSMKIYNITITRAFSSNANLSAINLSSGTLSPAFSTATSYAASADFWSKSITLTPNVAQADATIQVRVNGGAYSSITNGTASGALALGVGKNTIEVKVTAQDGTTTKTYSIEVTRDPMIIQTVAVGDAGNAPDVTGYGAVSYPYRIGKYEITLGEYAEFLNAVAKTSDPYGLYPMGWGGPELMRADVAGISRDFTNGVYTFTPVTPVGVNPAGADSSANRPVSFMTLFNAARFANWLANGQPSGGQDATTTEDGVYALNGATSGAITRNATNPNTGAPPTWWIPTENEWYKAAYYKGGGTKAGYWLYPTQSDTKPGNTIGGSSNQANHKLLNGAGDAWVYSVPNVANALYSQNALTDVGAFSNSASAYGTFDQGGNVWEWSYTQVGDSYLIRGGDYGSANADSRDFLKSSADQVSIPAHWKGYSGFRMATLPNAVASPRILSISRGVNGFSLSWTNGPNVHVQRRTSLSTGAWETISSNNTTGTHLDTAPPANRGFYRLIVP